MPWWEKAIHEDWDTFLRHVRLSLRLAAKAYADDDISRETCRGCVAFICWTVQDQPDGLQIAFVDFYHVSKNHPKKGKKIPRAARESRFRELRCIAGAALY